MARYLTISSVVRTVQGCDGYSMDLSECAEAYGVTPDEMEKFIAENGYWILVQADRDGNKTVYLDGE